MAETRREAEGKESMSDPHAMALLEIASAILEHTKATLELAQAIREHAYLTAPDPDEGEDDENTRAVYMDGTPVQ